MLPDDGDVGSKLLGELSTYLPDLDAAHRQDEPELAQNAQTRLLLRYRRPILRYVRHALPNQDDCELIFQNFAINFVQGKYRGFDPGRGRFREYLKRALFNLVHDYYRENHTPRRVQLDVNNISVAVQPRQTEVDPFQALWSEEVVKRGLDKLDQREREKPRSFVGSVIRLKAENPARRSADLARILTARKGIPVTAEKVRKDTHLARGLLIHYVIEEVRSTLGNPSLDDLEEELIDLGLHSLCKTAIQDLRDRGLEVKPELGRPGHQPPISDSPARIQPPSYLDNAAEAPRS
jgi:DNA-directed RNA polymerase specialized sigma24 family protein